MARPSLSTPVQRVIDPALWSDPKVISLGKPKSSTLMLFLYLLTHPNSGRIPGVLFESLPSIAVRMGWKTATARELFKVLEGEGLAYIDSDHWLVWLPNAIKYNPPRGVAEIKLWQREWQGVAKCDLKTRIASELAAHLAPDPRLAVAFAEYCLGRPAAPTVGKTRAKAGKAATEAAKAAEVAMIKAAAVVDPAGAATPARAAILSVGAPNATAEGTPPTEMEAWEAEFQSLWALYPKRAGTNPRKLGFTHFAARRRQGVTLDEMKAGLERYVRFCEATDKLNTETVMQASRFFGTSELFREPWELPRDCKIAFEIETHPDFERVFAAHPNGDCKADAWDAWKRLESLPDAPLVNRMVESLGEWNRFKWTDPKFVMPLHKWLHGLCWRRKFANDDDKDKFSRLVAIMAGDGVGKDSHPNGYHGDGGNSDAVVVYEGEVVSGKGVARPAVDAHHGRLPPPTQIVRSNPDPFDLSNT